MNLPGVIAGIGGVIFAIWDFIKDFVKRRITTMPFFLAVLGLNLLMLPVFIFYFKSIVDILFFLKNQIDYFISFFFINSISSEIGKLFLDVLKSLRFFDALKSALDLYYPVVTSVLIIIACKLFLGAYKFLREQILVLCVSRI